MPSRFAPSRMVTRRYLARPLSADYDPYQQLRATLKLQLALSTPATPETWRTCYSYNMRQNENVIEEKMLGRIAFLLGARLSFDSCPKVEAWSC